MITQIVVAIAAVIGMGAILFAVYEAVTHDGKAKTKPH